jgi:tetratricopeptide (TPR) repeat protein
VSNLGDLSGAEANYQKARQLFEALAAQPEPAPADIDELAHVHIQLSRFFIIKGNLEQAERHAAEAVAILDADASTLAANGRDGRLATANHQLGFVQVTRRDTAPAVASLSRAMDHAARAVAARPDDPASVSRLARIAPDYASAMLEAGAAGDALETIRAARKQLETLIARDPENARYRADLALLQSTESDALDALDQPDEALRMQTLSMTGLEQLIAAQPTDQGIRVGAMLGHCSLGRRLLKYRQREAGIARLRQCIEDGLTITRASPTNYFARAQLGHARLGLGEVLLADRRSAAEGCRQLRFGLEDLAALAATAPELSFERGAVKYDRLLTTCGAGH